jgi:NADH-quinone oxidoreductase subunit F
MMENTDMEETRLILKNVGKMSPVSSREYAANGGYEALRKALAAPGDIIGIINDAGMRGRSGSGFPVGIKWNLVKNSPSDQKYVVCNADEGEPGTGKDRIIMSGDPHSLIEGMTICSIAVGADKGFIYLRAEYQYICEILEKSLIDARENGFLGNSILGSSFNFDIEIRTGAGAYICGEETGLIESIEGRRGEPRLKPPFPGVKGLWGMPTAINNVETFVNIPIILNHGASGFRRYGTEKCPGTKLFTLSGNIVNPGVYEFPMGVSMREMFEKVGGGCPNGKKLHGIQTGGSASGTFIRPELLDTPMDIEGCAAVGAVFGTGNLMFFDEDSCIVELCRSCMKFFVHESCGKCTPCRFGNQRMVELLTKIINGEGAMDDLIELKELAEYIKINAFCGLGQMAPTAVVSALANFSDEFEAHIKHKKCIAGVCGFGRKWGVKWNT